MFTKNTSLNSSKSLPTYLPWLIWSLGAIFYFYEFFLQVSPSVIGSDLMQAFSTDDYGLGILASVYFYSYAAMQIPAGVLLDRVGPRNLITGAILICALGALFFGMTEYLSIATASRFLIGFGSAFALVGTMKLAANWFPLQKFSLLTGFMVTIGMLGAISGQVPLALLVDSVGWRHSMMFLGISGFILAAIIYYIMRDKPADLGYATDEEHTHMAEEAAKLKKESILHNLKNLWRKKQIWVVAIYGGLAYAPSIIICTLWGIPFFIEKYGISRTEAASMVQLILVGWLVAAPMCGWYSDRIARRLRPMYIGTTIALLLLAAIIYLDPSILITNIMLFAFGVCSAGFLPAFSIIRENTPTRSCATALGFMNMMNMVGVAFGQPFVGYLLTKVWSGELSNNIPVHTISDYHIALTPLVLMLVIAVCLLPFIKETYCKLVYED